MSNVINSQIIKKLMSPNIFDIDEILVVTNELIFYVYDKNLNNIYSIGGLPFTSILSI